MAKAKEKEAEDLFGDGEDTLASEASSEVPDPFADIDESELDGVALTAKLNRGIEQNFVEIDYSQRIGVFGEPHKVKNVPANMTVQWSTPERIDGGAHLNALLDGDAESKGAKFRFIHPREMTKNRSNRGAMFVSAPWEAEGDRVRLHGSYLLGAHRSYVEASKAAQYAESRRRTDELKVKDIEDAADELTRIDSAARVTKEQETKKVDVTKYNPMRQQDSGRR